MGARGPGEPPPVVTRRARRARRQKRVQQQTQGAKPLSQKPVRPQRVAPTPRQVQQATRGAKPLVRQRPVRPQTVAKPLRSTPPRNIRAGKPVTTPRQARSVQRAAYDQLSTGAKRAHLAAAKKRLERGKATDYDKTILHAHTTRVQGKRKRTALAEAQMAGYQSQGEQVEMAARRAAGKLALKPGHTFGETKRGRTEIRDQNDRKVGEAQVFTGGVASKTGVANLRGPVALAAPAVAKALEKIGAPKIVKTAARETADIAIGAPTAYVRLATAPKETIKAGIKEYQKLAKDPKGYAEKNPVSTLLMATGPLRGASRAANTAARRVGVQTSARPVRELPGSAVKEVQPAARGVVHRAIQTAKDKRQVAKRGAPQMTQRHLDRRVDDEFAGALRNRERQQDHIVRHYREALDKDLPAPPLRKRMTKEGRQRSKERMDKLEEISKIAHEAAKDSTKHRFAREFGATARQQGQRVVDSGHREGQIYKDRAEAEAVVEALNKSNPTIKRGATMNPLTRTRLSQSQHAKADVPVEFKVMQLGGRTGEGETASFAVVPKSVQKRLERHEAVGSSQSSGAKVLRESRAAFTRTVLPWTPTWYSGQGIEGSIRAALAQAGPTNYLRGRAAVKQAEAIKPRAGARTREIATPGGIATHTQAEFPRRPLHETFPDSPTAQALSTLGRAPGIKQVRRLNQKLTDALFERFNGRILEGIPQTAMLGKALRESPLMERGFGMKLDKALEDSGKGLTASENQIAAGRAVQQMYGKYSGHSPKQRELITHWTPFLPYYINTARFVLSTLPRNHPLFLAITADLSRATEEWREQKGMSLRHPGNQRPMFMLGGFPVSGDNPVVREVLGVPKGEEHIARVGHYTPAGAIGDPFGATAALPLPQFQGMFGAISAGVDWKGDPLKHPDGRPFSTGEKWLYGTVQLAEAMVPLLSKYTDVYGVPLVGKTIDETGGRPPRQLLRPLSTVKARKLTGEAGGELDLELSPTQLQELDLGLGE